MGDQPKRAGLLDYLKRAALSRWNLLLVGAGTVFAFLTGHPDAVLPVVMAAEVGWLTLATSNARFRQLVDSEVLSASEETAAPERLMGRVQQMLGGLDEATRARFDALRVRCEDLRRIGRAVKASAPGVEVPELDDVQLEGINELLWTFLRLGYARCSLDKFFRTTTRGQLERAVADAKAKEAQLAGRSDETAERMRQSLEGTLAAAQARLDNFDKAKNNYEFLGLEMDRIETTLAGLVESAVNRSDPASLSKEVTAVADTMKHTEQTLAELGDLTDLQNSDDEVPVLVGQKGAGMVASAGSPESPSTTRPRR
jgi:hypothetical protein